MNWRQRIHANDAVVSGIAMAVGATLYAVMGALIGWYLRGLVK